MCRTGASTEKDPASNANHVELRNLELRWENKASGREGTLETVACIVFCACDLESLEIRKNDQIIYFPEILSPCLVAATQDGHSGCLNSSCCLTIC